MKSLGALAILVALTFRPGAIDAKDLTAFVAAAARDDLKQNGAASVSIGIMQQGRVVLARVR
ncbi:MAG: hypothetical protein JO043_08155 [Candidatus Eremiobacteraeota bacterium]|nr:hypothetical protein [Candidatus Eremiobacteraeota bacterium]